MSSTIINTRGGRWLRSLIGIATVVFIAVYAHPAPPQDAKCPFDTDNAQNLTKCLLRHVNKKGILGKNHTDLPAPLDGLIGKPMNIRRESLQKFLQAQNIPEADVGGSIATALPETVRFFVIHDTSSPFLGDKNFASDINEKTWVGNNLKSYKAVAHVFVNRVGESVTKVNFEAPLSATKFERDNIKHIGKFVHIEMIQPRRRDPDGPAKNDFIAPDPGFSQAQLDRLALLYIVSSARRGAWLIPAFHCATDAGIPNAHDDPQNFDMNAWLKSLQDLLIKLKD
jgi:hypothetical protein